jgi:hypothetical protein
VRPLAISCARIEPMGGGADTLSESKSHSTPGVRPGHGEKALSYPWFTRTRRGWWDATGIDAWGAGDENSRQASGSRQGGRCGIPRFSRRERTVVRRHPSRGAGRSLAGTSDRAPAPVAWLSSKHRVRFGTVVPAPPYGRGGTDSHLSGSCHRWDGRGSRRWGRRDTGGTS